MSQQLAFGVPWADTGDRRPPSRAPKLAKVIQFASPAHAAASEPQEESGLIPVVRLLAGPAPGRRKCSDFARARTINVGKLSKAQRQAAYTLSFWDREIDEARPRFRWQCETAPRPCPWLLCRHHTAITIDEERGSIKEIFPELRILDDPEGPGLAELERLHGTCSLDFAAKFDDGTGGIGGLVALYQAAASGRPLGQTPGATIEEVGRAMNLSVERVRQLGSGAMQEVRIKVRRLER